MKYILEQSHCHYIELCGIPDGSLNFRILKKVAAELGLSFFQSLHSRGCYLPLQGTWDSFIKGKSEKFRKSYRNNINRLMRLGRLETTVVELSSNYDEVVKKLMEVDTQSWKASWISEAANKGFILELLKRCLKNRWLNLCFLELNGAPIAYWFMIRFGGKSYAMFTSYKEKFADYSPGLVCLYFVLLHLFKESGGIEEVDFLSSYNYLQRWTNLTRNRYLLTIYKRDLAGRAFHLGRMSIHRIRRRISSARW